MTHSRDKRYRSVSEMVRDLSGDDAFAEKVRKMIAGRNIIDTLMAMRISLGLSQKDVADRMRCTQSRVSKLENGNDPRIGDCYAYADALGLEVAIVIAKKGRTEEGGNG